MHRENRNGPLEIVDWGRMAYETAWQRQQTLVEDRIAGRIPDRLILVEHPPVVTLGRSAGSHDLCVPKHAYRRRGVALVDVDRGGKATYHGPGQLVAYPILKLRQRDLHRFAQSLLAVVSMVLKAYGLDPALKNGSPGVWVASAKIASLGMAVRKWVTYHGISLNVNTDLTPFRWIIPCGHPDERMTSMARQLGRPVDMDAVKSRFVDAFKDVFEYSTASQVYPTTWRNDEARDGIEKDFVQYKSANRHAGLDPASRTGELTGFRLSPE